MKCIRLKMAKASVKCSNSCNKHAFLLLSISVLKENSQQKCRFAVQAFYINEVPAQH